VSNTNIAGMTSRNVTDLIGSAKSMPGVESAELYSDTAAQVCRRSLELLFQGKQRKLISNK